MARSFLAGSISGAILGLGLATVVSIVAPPPQPPQVTTSVPDTSDAPTVSAAEPQAPSPGDDAPSGSDDAPMAETSTPTAAPDPDTLAALDDETLEPGTVPSTGAADGLAEPADAGEYAGVALEGDDPVLPNPQALAPMAPQPADDLSISTEPAQPPLPEADDAQSAFDDTPDDTAPSQDMAAQEEPEAPSDSVDNSPAPVVAQDDPLAPAVPVPEEDTALATPQPDSQTTQPQTPIVTPAAPSEGTPSVDTAEAAPPATPEPVETDVAESEAAEETPEATDEGDTQVAMVAPASRPQVGRPAISLTERETGVAIRRPGTAAEAGDETDAGQAAEEPVTNDDPRPVARFAQRFENPEAKPLMSIVLIDDGSSPTSGEAGLAALKSFPNAITFAVDADLPDAADRMALYRAQGFEVLAMVDLPQGAQASDAETSLNVVLSNMSEVVGVLEGTDTGLQGERAASDQVTAILSSTGHGLLTQNRGLNTMPKLARKQGVPAAPIFRDFDSKDQTATVIRRFLDQAAFKAGQEGAVIMLGRMRPDTISALLLWGLQDRAGQVAIAPVSAVLTREDG